jgi:uncharacterized protein YndB with AHSA1/START domain
MSNQTDNSAKEVQEFTISRVFAAPRELIWSALTDPEQLVNFWGPVGTTDPRQGGAFELTMVVTGDGTEHAMNAVYREFVEPERMVFETAGGITGTIELADLGDGTTEFKWTTRAEMDAELLKNATIGTNSAADQLGEHLTAIQA